MPWNIKALFLQNRALHVQGEEGTVGPHGNKVT